MTYYYVGNNLELSRAELKEVLGDKNIELDDGIRGVLRTKYDVINIALGSIRKTGIEIDGLKKSDCFGLADYLEEEKDGRIVFALSAIRDKDRRDLNKLGLKIKKELKIRGRGVRFLATRTAEVNSKQWHQDDFARNKAVEIYWHKEKNGADKFVKIVDCQNPWLLAKRDYLKPERSMATGMLPPKLALVMINLAVGNKTNAKIWDPFCGTGTVLGEGLLRGLEVWGSDNNNGMIEKTKMNLKYLTREFNIKGDANVIVGDARNMNKMWGVMKFDAIITEGDLGPRFHKKVTGKQIEKVYEELYKLYKQVLSGFREKIKKNGRVVICLPVYFGGKTRAPYKLRKTWSDNEFCEIKYDKPLIYMRKEQIVSREIVVLRRR